MEVQIKVGQTIYRSVERDCEPLTVTKVGPQWFSCVDSKGRLEREQRKHIGDGKYRPSSRYFTSIEDAVSCERGHLEEWREKLDRGEELFRERVAKLKDLTQETASPCLCFSRGPLESPDRTSSPPGRF